MQQLAIEHFKILVHKYFRNFNDVQYYAQWLAILFQVNHKSNKCSVIGRCPCIHRKVQYTTVLLNFRVSHLSYLVHQTFSLTCSILAILCRARANTIRTSWDTVDGEGMQQSGRPVFIKDRKPRSFTISKGRALSQTQRTISALQGVSVDITCYYERQTWLPSLCAVDVSK